MSDRDNEEKSGQRRRNVLINPSFQWRHSITLALIVFLVSSIISCVLYGVLHHQARMVVISPRTYTPEVTGVILFFAVAFSGLTAGGVGLWFMMVSHRICGPLHVLKHHLAELSRGRIPHIRPLRRRDEFKDLFATLDSAVNFIKVRRQYELHALHDVIQSVESAATGEPVDHAELLRSVAGQLRKIRSEAAFLTENVVDAVPSDALADAPPSHAAPSTVGA